MRHIIFLIIIVVLCSSCKNKQNKVNENNSQTGISAVNEKNYKYLLRSGKNILAVEENTGRISLLASDKKIFIGKPATNGPLRLHVPLEDYEAHLIEASKTKPEIHLIENGKELIITYPKLKGKRGAMDIKAELHYVSIGDGSFSMYAVIENKSGITIPQVFFPWVAGISKISGDDDKIKFPRVSVNPWDKFKEMKDCDKTGFTNQIAKPQFEVDYMMPYYSGMKWMDMYNKNAGISLFSKDTSARTQYFFVTADKYGPSTIDMSWYYYPYIRNGESWQSPVFVVYPHDGDWHYGVLKFAEYTKTAFKQVNTSPESEESLGEFSLWMSWIFQNWRDVKYKFTDLAGIAREAKDAGFAYFALLTFCDRYFLLPHHLNKYLGSVEDFRKAIEDSRNFGVDIMPFISCHLINDMTIKNKNEADEWYRTDVAGHRHGDNWTYHYDMAPVMPIRQIPTHAAYYICPGSKNWTREYTSFLHEFSEKWGAISIGFDQSFPIGSGLCFNPAHHHNKPDDYCQLMTEMLRKTHQYFKSRNPKGIMEGECQWDNSTQWQELTWDWLVMGDEEETAPFQMAFPKSRSCVKAINSISCINRIFTAGYWIDLYINDGGVQLGSYPELTKHLSSLAAFKKKFIKFFCRNRDAYFHNMYVETDKPEGAWVRVHKTGNEALIMVTEKDGKETDINLTIDLKSILEEGQKELTVYSRTLQKLNVLKANDKAELKIHLPKEDFVGIFIK